MGIFKERVMAPPIRYFQMRVMALPASKDAFSEAGLQL
jgi:hypothetical protein